MTSSEYIQHHMHNLEWNVLTGSWGNGGFWTLNIDTLFFSCLLGFGFLFGFVLAAKRVTSGVPGRWQNLVEMLIEFVDQQVLETLHKKDRFVGSLALTIFVWVLLMNTMDLVPVDLLPRLGQWMGIHYLRVVPTTDLSLTFALSLSVFLIILFDSFRFKGWVWGIEAPLVILFQFTCCPSIWC